MQDNSGYKLDQVKKIILAGIKGYYGKVKRRRKERSTRRVHLTALESGGARWRKKLLSKTTWYRGNKRNEETSDPRYTTTKKTEKRNQTKGEDSLKTRTVLFVPQTPGGELARQTREVLERMKDIMGWKIKVVERAGVSLQNQFSQSGIWRGLPCERQDCIPCTQGGEDTPECTKTSVVYENIC